MKTEWWTEPNGASTLIYCRFPVGEKVGGAYVSVSNLELAYMKFPEQLIADSIQRIDEQRRELEARTAPL